MTDQVSELVQRGRAISTEDRELLVDQLLESLNEPAASALDASWEAEIRRRLEAFDRGDLVAVDAADVFAKARRIAT